jgi:DNA-binding NarL/FixJ family response regulator
MHRILIVEPHPMARCGLAQTLSAEPDLTVCGQVATSDQALQAIDDTQPDVLILALHLPGMCGLGLTRKVLARFPNMAIVTISEHGKPLCAERALRTGARGFVTSDDSAEEIITAIRAAATGSYHVCRKINAELLQAIARHPEPIIPSPIDVLSDREMEVFRMMGEGTPTQAIADRMSVSIKTIESYRARVKTKLRITDMPELMLKAAVWASDTRVCLMWSDCSTTLPEQSPAANALV